MSALLPLLSSRNRERLSRMALSSAELQAVLLRGGAQLVARPEYGVFLRARRHLIFVRRAEVLGAFEVYDALRLAGITPALFRELLREVRGASSS